MGRLFDMFGSFYATLAALLCFTACEIRPDELPVSESPLYISEYMNRNESILTVRGSNPSWVEIHNPSDHEVSTKGFKLCVNSKKCVQIRSTIIPAGQNLVVLIPENKLVEQNDTLFIIDGDKKLVDLLITEKTKKNRSVWRRPDGQGSYISVASETPTPQFSNDDRGAEAYRESLRTENTTGIIFNELLLANKTAYMTEDGEFVDYVELLNTSSKSVDISGFGLSDNFNHVFKYKFPKGSVLEPDEIKLVEIRDFSVKNGKEALYFSNEDGFIIEESPLIKMKDDQALVRRHDGSYFLSHNITPGLPNTVENIQKYASARYCGPLSDSPVIISEGMSKNTQYAPLKGHYHDWIELYNRSDAAVELNGWKLSDGEHEFTFGEKHIIGAGKYLLVYSSEDNLPGALNTGFDLNGNCELYLTDAKDNLADGIGLNGIPCDVSKGRVSPDGSWQFFKTPTPGAKNGTPTAWVADSPLASKASGQYAEGFELILEGEGSIYYTTDGSAPTASSIRYTAPIHIDKSSVIRTICVAEGAITSPSVTYNYILGRRHNMDILCLSSAPEGLYSWGSGIFAMGPGASEASPHFGANFWKGWKRVANAEFIPADGSEGWNAGCDMSIFGGFSKALPKKSVKLKFKDIYGAPKIKYPLFDSRDYDEFHDLVVRGAGQDSYDTFIKDDLISYLADTLMYKNTMASHPVVVYINAEYKGVYFLREKVNADFVAKHYDVDPKPVDLIQGQRSVQHGSVNSWLNLLNYVRSHNMADPECYKYVCDRVDVQNYADYVIIEAYCENGDLGNYRFFRSPEIDGKWRWILYDTDMSFRPRTNGGAYAVMNPAGINGGLMFQTVLINGLLKNKDFRELFINRLEYQMKHIWNVDRVNAGIDHFVEMIGEEMPYDRKHWNYGATNWPVKIENLRKYISQRQSRLRNEFETNEGLKRIIKLDKAELDRIFGVE